MLEPEQTVSQQPSLGFNKLLSVWVDKKRGTADRLLSHFYSSLREFKNL